MLGSDVLGSVASAASSQRPIETADMKEVIDEHLAVQALIRGYQVTELA